MSNRVVLILLFLSVLPSRPSIAAGEGVAGSDKSPAQPRTTPEIDLATIKLTPQAEERIGLKVERVEHRQVLRRRLYGAELMLPPGRSTRIVSPFTGLLHEPTNGPFPQAGSRVTQGQSLVGIQPILLEPDRLRVAEVQLNLVNQRAVVEAELARAEADVKLAKENVERGVKLVAADAGSTRGLQEVRTALAAAMAARQSARTRRAMYEQLGQISPTILPTTWLSSPLTGIIRDVAALPGQVLVTGAPILEIADTSTLWVRVAVAVDEAAQVKRGPAFIRDPGRGDSNDSRFRGVEATQVLAPPTANAQSATVDFYYLLQNTDGRWSPGTRVEGQVSLEGLTRARVVPWSAVVSDVNGESWVYVRVGPHAYARRRVSVDAIQDGSALLSVGPSAGTTIVKTGVIELFGLDVGFAK